MTALKIANAPLFDWNGRRLVASIAMAKGHSVFVPPEKVIGISGINGPMFVFAYLPAAIATTPDAATQIGAFIAFLFVLGPAILLLRLLSKEWLGLAILLVLFCFHSQALSYSAFMVHADSPAIGLCTLTCYFTLLWLKRNNRKFLAFAGICAALAFFSKITFLPIVAAIPFYLFFAKGTRNALESVAAIALGFVVVGGLFVAVFGYEPLHFNMFPVQNKFSQELGNTSGTAMTSDVSLKILFAAFIELVQEYYPFLFLATLFCLSIKKRQSAGIFLLVVSALMLPAALVGRAHSGGAINTQSPTVFFLILSVTILISEWEGAIDKRFSRHALTAGFLLMCLLNAKNFYGLTWPLKNLATNPQKLAFEHSKRHPGETYFPDYPLASLIAEERLYHSGRAVAEFSHSDYRFSPETFKSGLPPQMRRVAFDGAPYQSLLNHLPNFTQRTNIAELPNWTVLEKP